MKKEIIITGVGGRRPDKAGFESQHRIASALSKEGVKVRTGDAIGVDSIYRGHYYFCENIEVYRPTDNIPEKAFAIASTIHPYWFKKDGSCNLKEFTRRLMARSVMQVLGKNLNSPSSAVVCWTKDGCEHRSSYAPLSTGGTGIAISVASDLGKIAEDFNLVDEFGNKLQDIPVFNTCNQGQEEKFMSFYKQLRHAA